MSINMKIIKHVLVGVATIMLVLTPWMIMGKFFYTGLLSPFTVASKEVNLASRVFINDYVKEIINTLGVFLTILLVVGSLRIVYYKNRINILLMTWISVGFISILTIIHKEVRFLTFLSPALAVFSMEGTVGIVDFVNNLLRKSYPISILKYALYLLVGLLFLLSSYQAAIEYSREYYYVGASEAKIFEYLSIISASNNIDTILVYPRAYPYAGLFLPNTSVYLMDTYNRNWIRPGLRGIPPNINSMIKNKEFDYIVYCDVNYLRNWLFLIQSSGNYMPVKEFFSGKCIIFTRS